MHKFLSCLFVLLLGTLCILPFFVIPTPGIVQIPSREFGRALHIAEAAALYSISCFIGKPTLLRVIVFSTPVTSISLLLVSNALWDGGLKAVAEPILCVWIGALIVWASSGIIRGMFNSSLHSGATRR